MRGKEEVVLKQRWQMVGSHTARRIFITLAAEKLMPDHIIMAITGIRDPKTLNKYKKINKESIIASAFRIFS
jgi:ABC-type hemin transport system substrate-binding protein